MKRNDEYVWYQKGYRQAVTDKRVNSFIPKTVGVFLLLGLAFINPVYPFVIFTGWTVMVFFDWKHEKENAIEYEPPTQWE